MYHHNITWSHHHPAFYVPYNKHLAEEHYTKADFINTLKSSNCTMTKQDKPSTLDMFMKIQEDCDRPACDDTKSALSSALNRLNKNKGKDVLPTASASKQESISPKECPPSKSVIGDSTWTLMHSMVSNESFIWHNMTNVYHQFYLSMQTLESRNTDIIITFLDCMVSRKTNCNTRASNVELHGSCVYILSVQLLRNRFPSKYEGKSRSVRANTSIVTLLL